MPANLNIDRSRRCLLKATGLVAAAFLGTIALPGPAAAQDAQHGDDNEGSGGPCFLRGTRIRTPGGYRAIETLAAGDKVAARFAGLASVKAIDSFTLCRGGPRRDWLGYSRPVRVKRGALGEGMPRADLCLTASHAVYVDGFLVPAGHLVNGASIVLERAERHETLDFFHIELEVHDVLDAEGAPCESLRHPEVKPCVPLLSFDGGRSELRSRLRSAASLVVDRRLPIDIIRDSLEERGLHLARAAA